MKRAAFALVLASCASAPVLPDALRAELQQGGFVSGKALGVGPAAVLNDEDFIWDARWANDSERVVLSRLGRKTYDAVTWKVATPPIEVSTAVLVPHEHDVEQIVFSPDGAWVASAAHDGAVRVSDVATGKLWASFLTEEPLDALAWRGNVLAVGSHRGLITLLVFDGKALQWSSEVRAHADAVRALEFLADGRLVSGSWDKTIAVFAVETGPGDAQTANAKFERKGGVTLVRAMVNGRVVAPFALDARMPALVVVRAALAQSAGIEPALLKDEVKLPAALGQQVARVAHGASLQLKGIRFEGVDVAVCDACVPADAQGVLGQAFVDSFELTFDEAAQEARFRLKAGVASKAGASWNAKEQARFSFPAAVNDFSADAAGKVLGVAFSEVKGERTREVYEREKRKEVVPVREWNVAARVEVATGKVLERLEGHRGVVSSCGISPDGLSAVTGGWDKQVRLGGETIRTMGWAVRRVRWSPDGRRVVVGAWTPQNPVGSHKTEPSAVVFEVRYGADARVVRVP